MRSLILAAILLLTGSANAQMFTDKDRFGKTNEQVYKMGHDGWVKWFTDPSRAGENGLFQSEDMYAMALYNVSLDRMKSKSEADRKFYEDARLEFANMSKYAFCVASSAHPYPHEPALWVKKSGTAINQTVMDFIIPPYFVPLVTEADARKKHKSSEARLKPDNGANLTEVKANYQSLTHSMDRLSKLLEGRNEVEKSLAWNFVLTAIEMSLNTD